MLRTSDKAYIRLKEEQSDLKVKVEKLEIFVRAARRSELNDLEITLSEIQLLEEQLHYMRGYLRILNARISLINE